MSNSDATVRDFVTSDYSSVLKLWESTGLGGSHRGDNLEVIRRTLQNGGRFLVQELNNTKEIIGTSWLTVDGRRTYLHHFGIAVPYQRKGYAKQLLEASFQVAKSIGYQLKLEVHRENLPAVTLYRKAGFTYLGDYDVYIIRNLNNPG